MFVVKFDYKDVKNAKKLSNSIFNNMMYLNLKLSYNFVTQSVKKNEIKSVTLQNFDKIYTQST